MSTRYIYTEKNNCQDCYKCIRECPVKAIKMEDQSASIIQEYCIYCGHCTQVCPVGAKKVKEDVSKVKYLLTHYNKVFVSLAPSYQAEFPGFRKEDLIYSLKKLGFKEVSETALGADIVSQYINKHLSDFPKGVNISSCCPSTIELIRKYFPEHEEKIMNIDSPMIAHGKFLREYYGDDIKIVFIGPCIAKKKEADQNPGIIDAVLTYKRLREWLEEEELIGIPDSGKEQSFAPFEAGNGSVYPVEGGMGQTLEVENNSSYSCLSFSGMSRVMPVIKDLDNFPRNKRTILELMSCEGGCINGPGITSHDSLALKALQITTGSGSRDMLSLTCKKYTYLSNPGNALEKFTFTQEDIKDTLLSIGKQNPEDELNCGGCGYESCQDFAKAVLTGKAEREMCVSYMRRIAQNKASALLQRMPYGVVILDEKLKIVESNKVFAELSGEEAVWAFNAKPGLQGADLKKLVPYSGYFENLINAEEPFLEKDIKTDSHLLHLSVFPIQKNHLLCGIIRNLRAPELNREEIVKRTREVIRQNLKTVQKIAFHLGENASNMETLLNSIADIQNEDYEE